MPPARSSVSRSVPTNGLMRGLTTIGPLSCRCGRMDRGPFGAGHRHSVCLQRAEGVTGADLGMTGPECDNDMNHHHARRPLPTVGRSSPKNLTDPGVGFLL